MYRSGAGHPPPGGYVTRYGIRRPSRPGAPRTGGASVGGRTRSAIHTCGLRCGRIQVRRAEIQVNDAIDLWRRCTETLRDQVPEAVWQTSLVNVSPSRVDDHSLVLSVPGSVLRDRIEARYLGLISAAASKVADHPVEVILEVVAVDKPVDTLFTESLGYGSASTGNSPAGRRSPHPTGGGDQPPRATTNLVGSSRSAPNRGATARRKEPIRVRALAAGSSPSAADPVQVGAGDRPARHLRRLRHRILQPLRPRCGSIGR